MAGAGRVRHLEKICLGHVRGNHSAFLFHASNGAPTLPAQVPAGVLMVDMLRFMDDVKPLGRRPARTGRPVRTVRRTGSARRTVSDHPVEAARAFGLGDAPHLGHVGL